jgi:hypothetical protein
VETITVGLWSTNIEPPAASLAAWTALVDARMAKFAAPPWLTSTCRSDRIASTSSVS